MRIAIWAYDRWAFGQIFRALKKYSNHQIDLLPWNKVYKVSDFDNYDVIHVPVVQAYHSFVRRYPSIANKVGCSTHGKAELYNYNPDTQERHSITREMVESNKMTPEMIKYVNGMGKISCVSEEMVDLFKTLTNAQAVQVPCGVDPDIFKGDIIEHKRLTVVCPVIREDVGKSEHEYNTKRWELVFEMEARLPDVQFLFLKKKVSMDEIAEFYKRGDIILCLSHSEGNPLGIMEAGAMGLLPITTNVGAVPEFIQDGVNGMIIKGTQDKYIVEECVAKLTALNSNRKELMEMRKSIQKTINEQRIWPKLMDKWDSFFELCRKGVVMPKKKFRFHLLGLVHLPCSKEYMACAFTQKNYKLAKMLLSLGHEVFYYGAEGSTVPCTKFIQTHTLADIAQEWGDGDNRFKIGYDWMNNEFRHDFNKTKTATTLKFYEKCIYHINKIKKADDFLLVTQGHYQRPVADKVGLFLTCEPGIGYRGSYARFRAFESAYIQNFTYGSQQPFKCINGSYYDRVIPNYFEAEDFEVGTTKGNYYLYIGRLIKRKGVVTAALTCKEIGAKLILVGQNGLVRSDGWLTAADGADFAIPPGNWEYQGFADIEKRKKLMAGAIATFTPTEYLECFAGTHIESMLSGTPVITTNFGVFPGTVINGLNGYRCNTLNDFVQAAHDVKKLDPLAIRKHAEKYLTTNVRYEYQKWFEDLFDVYESTIDPSKKGWHRIRR